MYRHSQARYSVTAFLTTATCCGKFFSEIFCLAAKCEIIHSVNCEISHFVRCEMKFAHIRVSEYFTFAEQIFHSEAISLARRANFVEKSTAFAVLFIRNCFQPFFFSRIFSLHSCQEPSTKASLYSLKAILLFINIITMLFFSFMV